VTLMCYGGMSGFAMQAAEELLMEHEISCELLIPCQIKPVGLDGLPDSLARTGHLIVVEEGPLTGGWGAEIAARAQERCWDLLRGPVRRVAARDGIVPSTRPLEESVLPGKRDIVERVLQMVGRERSRG
jgi:pyruvate/2-oxoglutarate/acetoin dehydrogenase E1 component